MKNIKNYDYEFIAKMILAYGVGATIGCIIRHYLKKL